MPEPIIHKETTAQLHFLHCRILKYILISLITTSLFPLALKAAITGSLTRNPIYLDESTDLIIDLDSSGEEALKFPLHTNSYDVVARQSSSSITIINNKFIQTKQLAYTLRFRRSGIFTLPIQSSMSNDPKALLQIKVLEAYQQSNSTNNNSNLLRDQGVSSQLREARQETPFAIISVNKDNPFLNEQITFKLKIYHKGTLRQIQLPDFDLSNFIHKRAEKSKEYTENFNGEDYFIYELPYTLYPVKAGQVSIPARAILVSVLKENDANFDPFDPFANFNNSFSTETEKSLKTNALTINVKALPTPIPSGFKGYIGNLKLNHRLAQDSAINGEPLSIFTEISGDGNPNNLNLKELFLKSSDYNIYQDKSKKQSFPLSGKEQFRISISSALIPNTKNSSLKLSSNPLVIFNPETSRYETISSKEFDIKIQEKKLNSNINNENDRSVLFVHEDHEDDENAEIGVRLHAPKKLSHIRSTSIQNYSKNSSNPNLLIRLVRDSYFNLYLLTLVIILNLIAYSPSILRIIRKLAEQKHYEKFPFKEYEKFILKNTNVSDISNKIKSLYSQIDLEQNIESKVSALDPELFEEFNRFIENTDRINYGIKENLDTELITSDLKERALKILKGLKRLYE
ncbi:MAG: hypothetical protein EBR67_01400 [Proteobacteria bacterium]|nr:hypothetical protein [Pseudomonadota bacterium]